MIIATGLLIMSVLLIFTSGYKVWHIKGRTAQERMDISDASRIFWISFFVALCSAQYIWG